MSKTVGDSRKISDLSIGETKRVVVYAVAALLAVGLFVAMVWKVFAALLLGVVAGVYLLPVQEWFEKRLRARAGSALVTMAVIVVPLVALVAYGWYETSDYSKLVYEKRDEITHAISESLARYFPVRYENTRYGVEGAFAGALFTAAETVQELKKKSALLLASATVFFFTVYYVLTQRAQIAQFIKVRVPGDYLELYERLTANVGGALRGALWAVFIDQSIKGLLILVLNLIFGVPLAVVLALAAFLAGFFPLLGIWIVYVPISIYLLVFRHDPTAAGIYFALGTILTFASSLFLRPMLASSATHRFNFYWMLIALVAGVFAFGIPGIVLGPAVLGFAKAVLDTLVGNVRYETSLLKEEKDEEKREAAAETAASAAD